MVEKIYILTESQINQIRAEVIEKCAKVVSSMVGICQSSCPIGCQWGTEKSCVELWKIYLTEQLKEQNECIE